ncbi:MAG: methyltransferase domain-containing protein [Rhodospirillaceae bacterium]|nr:methyltransferase domain-containing protein [Rhodospirillaceae bacterium]
MSGEQAFKDNFSGVADGYRRYRPTYPEALFDWLATAAPRRDRAWDCGCGSGQASVLLAPHFARVDATDPSAAQIAKATPNERVHYAVAPAESSGLPDHAFDLITVAQAIHWFDIGAFYGEARRVGRPDGLLAVIGYGLLRVEPAIDALLDHLYVDVVGPYWPPERRHIDEGYRSIPFPFAALDAPDFTIEREWSADHLLGYLATWSAVSRYKTAHGADPLEGGPGEALRRAWGDGLRPVRWPIFLKVGRVGG